MIIIIIIIIIIIMTQYGAFKNLNALVLYSAFNLSEGKPEWFLKIGKILLFNYRWLRNA